MKRGVITLKKNEIVLLSNLLATAPHDHHFITDKLKLAADDNAAESVIETTDDEVEYLLDLLPMPSPTEPLEIKQMRITLQQSLSRLRF